ncbi:10 TM acyl transferase domain found in Cas1p-domain-containing protein [Cladochytrium replicatum]|nr:10 TM acyl transferase domain found in Cas1p-domain-containing protein [Cladochytrium replicatum]
MKLNKHFTWPIFNILTSLSLLICLLTLQKLPDASFLNHNIMDEWKGWMQVAILNYHFVGASRILPVYICILAMLGSYLFMTGYGQFQSFYQKKDYIFSRMAKTFLRLNLLSLALAYVMDTDVLFFYFGPLVTDEVPAQPAQPARSISSLKLVQCWTTVVIALVALFICVMIYGQLFLDNVQMYKPIFADSSGTPSTAAKSGGFSDKKQYNRYFPPYLSPLIAVLYVLICNATPRMRKYSSWFFSGWDRFVWKRSCCS